MIDKVNRVKAGTIIAVVVLLIAGIAQYYDFKHAVNNNSQALVEVKEALVSTRLANTRVTEAFEARIKAEDKVVKEAEGLMRQLLSVVENTNRMGKKRIKR